MKIIGERVSAVAEIEPRVRVLVHEQRSARIDEKDPLILAHRTGEGPPARSRYRMLLRPDGEQVHRDHFRIRVPPVLQESVLRSPAMGKRLAPVQHPFPIGAASSSSAYLRMSGFSQNAAECSTPQSSQAVSTEEASLLQIRLPVSESMKW